VPHVFLWIDTNLRTVLANGAWTTLGDTIHQMLPRICPKCNKRARLLKRRGDLYYCHCRKCDYRFKNHLRDFELTITVADVPAQKVRQALLPASERMQTP
jgi:tRNA(Ile2) C34 agmatinyltransferase TiaS